MARLNDVEIVRRLVHKDPKHKLVITPMISAAEQIGPSSVDIHLGTDFLVIESSVMTHFDPLMSREEYVEWRSHHRFTSRYSVLDPFILHPRELVLATTLEFIAVPNNLVARLDGRSSWARQGLKVHSTAGDIHPGSAAFVVFELENTGPIPISLHPGMSIAQLTFEELVAPARIDYASQPGSKYRRFGQNLWSAYPSDSIIEALRRHRDLGPTSRSSTGS